MINKQIIFNKIINNLTLDDNIDLREAYDSTMSFNKTKTRIEINIRDADRFMVNSIRHNCSNYDNYLKYVYKLDKKDNVYYNLYKNNVLRLISERYPNLSDECNRQATKIKMIKNTG